MNKTILKSKNIKSEAFREYSHLQGYVTSKKIFLKTLYYNQIKKALKPIIQLSYTVSNQC